MFQDDASQAHCCAPSWVLVAVQAVVQFLFLLPGVSSSEQDDKTLYDEASGITRPNRTMGLLKFKLVLRLFIPKRILSRVSFIVVLIIVGYATDSEI